MGVNVSKSQLYPATFDKSLVIGEATKVLTNGEYVVIGEYTVRADELVGMGKGGYDSQQAAIGRLFAKFVDNSAEKKDIVQGKFRIELASSQNIPLGLKPVYLDVDLSSLRSGETSISDRYVFPFEGVLLSKDKKYVFKICNTSGADVTLSQENSTVLMDVTRALVSY